MSDGPTRQDFEEALKGYWHGRPPASLEDVMALYGVLAVAESGGGLYESPSKLQPFVDDGRLVEISIDLSGEERKVVGHPEVDTLREEDIPKLGYSHKSSGRGAKYSLTQIGSKNGNDAEGVSSTIIGRIRSWTGQDSVQSLTDEDEHPDSWIIDDLAAVFERDSETLEELKADIIDLLPTEDSIPTVATVRLKLDPADVKSVDGTEPDWYYPADIGVIEEAMTRYATANAANKAIDGGTSEGQGTGVVTGEEGRVVGTPESPLGVFSVKHPDAQPGLQRTASWRNYPVSEDVAMLFAKGQNLIDACVYRNGGMETYALPYFSGEITAQKAQLLYLAIQSVKKGGNGNTPDGPPMAQVTFHLLESDNEDTRKMAESELRFYLITMPISDDKNVIAEEPAASIYWPNQIADALETTIQGPTLSPAQGGFEPVHNWPLLDLDGGGRQAAYVRVVDHTFTDTVFGYRDEEGDDFRRIVDHRLLSGTPIEAQTLFEEYIQRYSDETDGSDPPSPLVVAQQLVHLETLSRAGLIKGLDAAVEPNETPMSETEIDTRNVAEIRKQRLERFLDRPLFDDSARRAAALSGVLVGQISWHQESERSIGRPLDAGTKGDQLTPNSLENALTSALEKAKLYAHDSDEKYHQNLLFPETVDQLLEQTESMPTEWEIDKSELRFCYVLGHAHGRRSMPAAFELSGENSAVEEDVPTAN